MLFDVIKAMCKMFWLQHLLALKSVAMLVVFELETTAYIRKIQLHTIATVPYSVNKGYMFAIQWNEPHVKS